jgi:RimJ/RimL family protein N-acetyltransferase
VTLAGGLPAPLPDPPLRDGGVLLRRWREADLDQIVAACRDPEIARWTTVPLGYAPADGREFLAAQRDRWHCGEALELAVADAAREASVLGSVALRGLGDGRADIGYWVAPAARGRGVATRAARLLAEYAFATLAVERLEVLVHPDNAASLGVARAAGFRREGLLRARAVIRGRRHDMAAFSRLPGDLG